MAEQLMKNFFLFMSKNRTLNQAAKKWGLKFGAARFVAGETVDQVIQKIRQLNEQGLECTVDYLGEFVSKVEEAEEMATMCIRTLEAINEHGVKSNLSLKLTSLGLDIDRELCIRNMRGILDTARSHGNFVRIDMEDYSHLEVTLSILRQLRKEGYENVGTVIQAYLYRTAEDVQALGEEGFNLRLVKGAYKEPATVAFPEKGDVDENYKKIIRMHLLSGAYTAIATHDEAMIQYTKQVVAEEEIPLDRFEFQMLYGIRSQRQLELAKEGYKMRVYVPYGNDWYGYFMRRLAERPANVAFVLKGMFKK